MKNYYVYILTNKSGTLYIGITNDLERRVLEHKQKLNSGFAADYNINQLVYFEESSDVSAAIAREKQLKGYGRAKKISLIRGMNPYWEDLGSEISRQARDDSREIVGVDGGDINVD